MSGGRELRDATALVFVDNLEAPALDEGAAHHLAEVLRVVPGEQIAVSDGRGAYRMAVIAVDSIADPARRRPKARARDLALGELGPVITVERPGRSVTVAFAIPKGDRAEWIVQKLTELGVDVITPLLSDRTVVRLTGADRERRTERFRRVAREAAAQCRRVHLPDVTEPTSPKELLGRPGTALTEPGGGALDAEVSTLLVGPEGGWSDEELALGQRQVDLGPLVLRAETAAVCAGVLLTAVRSGVMAFPTAPTGG